MEIYAESDPTNFFTDLEQAEGKLPSRRKEEFAKQGIAVETLLVRGVSSDEISRASKAYDLIVIGSRGLGCIKERLLRGVSGKVVLHSGIPMLVIGPE